MREALCGFILGILAGVPAGAWGIIWYIRLFRRRQRCHMGGAR